MRDIKFRAFIEGQDGKYSVDYSDPLFPHIFWNNLYKGIYDTSPNQYTGLKDKNRKEIYEGDILEFSMHAREVGVVIFRDGSFMVIRNSYDFCIADLEDENWCFFEILGNIYENPELLEYKINEK